MALYYVALGLLLVTPLSSVGILAIQAATWRLHWFVRTAIVLGCLSPLLWVPAFEPFVAFVLEAATVAGVIALGRRRAPVPHESSCATPAADVVGAEPGRVPVEATRARLPGGQLKISLLSLFLLTTLAAAGAAVFQRMPSFDGRTWLSILVVGTGSAGSVLLGRVGASGLFRGWLRWPIIVLGQGAIALTLALTDQFVWAMFNYGPSAPWFDVLDLLPELLWFAVCPGVTLASGIWLATQARRTSTLGRTIRGAFWLGALVPAYAWWSLVHLEPIPKHEPLEENAFDRILETAGRLPLEKFDQLHLANAKVFEETYSRALDEAHRELIALRPSLRWPSDVKIDYTSEEAYTKLSDRNQACRTLARILDASGRLQMQRGDSDEACASFLDAVHLGFNIRSRGKLLDFLVGFACSSTGISGLCEHRDRLTPEGRSRAVDELLALAESAEPYESFLGREWIWLLHTRGWSERLKLRLGALTHFSLDLVDEEKIRDVWKDVWKREQAKLRILAVDLALRSYHADHREYPESLEFLVPGYLDVVPHDPFSTRDERLRYALRDGDFVLYSVGVNQVDDGGQAFDELARTTSIFPPPPPPDLTLDPLTPSSQTTPQ